MSPKGIFYGTTGGKRDVVDVCGYFTRDTGGRGYRVERTSQKSLIVMFVLFFQSSEKKMEVFRGFSIFYEEIVFAMV